MASSILSKSSDFEGEGPDAQSARGIAFDEGIAEVSAEVTNLMRQKMHLPLFLCLFRGRLMLRPQWQYRPHRDDFWRYNPRQQEVSDIVLTYLA